MKVPTPEARQKRQERRLDRRITLVMWMALALLVTLLLLAPPVINASRNSNDSKRTDEISACRSVANSALNEARTARAEATTKELRARNSVENLRSLITEVAIFDQDIDQLNDLRAQLILARTALTKSEMDADEATHEERRQNDIYADLSRLSLEKPDDFLAQCRESV
jgi:hypothetical protein